MKRRRLFLGLLIALLAGLAYWFRGELVLAFLVFRMMLSIGF